MPAPHRSVIFDVADAKVYNLLTDVAGASPTYGPPIDVPGIAEVSLDPNLVTAELKGDSRIIAKKGRIDRFNVSCTYGKLDMDVLDVLINGTVADTGTGAAETAGFRVASPASLPYFKLAIQIQDVDTGLADITIVLYKCTVTGGTFMGTSSDNFGQPSFDAEGIALESSLPGVGLTSGAGTEVGVIMDLLFHETLVAL